MRFFGPSSRHLELIPVKEIRLLILAVWLFILGMSQGVAQTSDSSTCGKSPKVLHIFSEEIKLGKGIAHEQLRGEIERVLKRNRWPRTYLTMTSISGPRESWSLTAYDSFEDWEKDQQAAQRNTALMAELTPLLEKEGEYITSAYSVVAVCRQDLSRDFDSIKVP